MIFSYHISFGTSIGSLLCHFFSLFVTFCLYMGLCGFVTLYFFCIFEQFKRLNSWNFNITSTLEDISGPLGVIFGHFLSFFQMMTLCHSLSSLIIHSSWLFFSCFRYFSIIFVILNPACFILCHFQSYVIFLKTSFSLILSFLII